MVVPEGAKYGQYLNRHLDWLVGFNVLRDTREKLVTGVFDL